MKKIRNKKRINKIKIILIIILFIIILILLNKINININNNKNLRFILNDIYKNKIDYNYINKNIYNLFKKKNSIKMPIFLSNNSSNIKEEYKLEDEYNPKDYEKITSYIKLTNNNINDPLVYIYNTHQLETYSNINLNNNMMPNIMMAGSLLSENLNKNGIKTKFEDTSLATFIDKMGLPSNELYGGSRALIENSMEKYKTLKYFIDLHRDSVSKDISTININNINYARVLFVLGTSNKNYLENKKMMSKLDKIINDKYPKLSRGIYEVYFDDWNEVYNQDLNKNVILIELGAKDNNLNEVLNTIDVLTFALKKYIEEENE